MNNESISNLALQKSISSTEIVISLYDVAYRKIKSGVKNFEFRKHWIETPCIAYVYRLDPENKLSAFMKLGKPVFGSPEEIGEIAEKMAKGNGDSVEQYLASSQGGYAIPIEEFTEFSPIPLEELHQQGFHPPKHIFYLNDYPVLKQYLSGRVDN